MSTDLHNTGPNNPGPANLGTPSAPTGPAVPEPGFEALSLIQQDMQAIEQGRTRTPLLALTTLVIYAAVVSITPQRADLHSLMWQHILICGALGATGILAIVLGMHLSELKARLGLGLLGLTGVGYLAYALFSHDWFLPMPEEGLSLDNEMSCLRSGLLLTLPVLGITAWLLRSARLPTLLSSLLLGLGAGLMAVLVLHTHCPNTTPGHLLLSHGGVILLAMSGAAWYGQRMSRRSFEEVSQQVRQRLNHKTQ